MERIPGWLLPTILAVAQLAVWPGIPLATGDRVSAPAVATGVTATVAVAVALLWRRSAPPATIGIVAAALTVGAFGTPTDALLIIAMADMVALYSVAVLRTRRLAGHLAAAVMLWQCALIAATVGVTAEYPFEVAFILVQYPTVVAFGRIRHRWHAERATAAGRLAEAEDRRARAADTERHRLARELHDVTAHHLTSIVVIASAAQRLGAARPDLIAEAREFAARTGRDTLAALHRLVALLRLPDERPGPAADRLQDLAEGFRRLGQQVSLHATPEDLPAATTEAVCGITREALTNTLRYAPAGRVRIELSATAGGLELTVDDDGARADGVADVGSGRGVAGMRERATALGGSLSAGPRPGGGWRVHAVLPRATEPVVVRRRRRPGSEHIIDVMLMLLVLLPTATGLLADGGPVVPSAPLLGLVAAAHAVPVLWRRSHPWAVLGAVAVTSWAVPALIAVGLIPSALGWAMLVGLGAEAVAVYAVARYAGPGGYAGPGAEAAAGQAVARHTGPGAEAAAGYPVARRAGRNGRTALAIPVVLSSTMSATGVTMALDLPLEKDMPLAVGVIFMAVVIGCPLGLPMVGSWLLGFAVRRRHTRIEAREHDAVAAATAHAIWEAARERGRVAAGLRAAVLRDTARVATAADAGDLDQVLASARAALDAMRGLLNGLRDEPDPARGTGDRDPQPTTAALPGLAERWRGGGRQVGLELTGAGRALPADVDLSAFRVVELLLAGDTGPTTVRVDLTGDPLRIGIRPMPPDEGGEIAAGLRARLSAVGGSMITGADGLPEILLPAPPLPHPAGATGPVDRAGHPTGTMPAGDAPETPAGDDKEVASSPSA